MNRQQRRALDRSNSKKPAALTSIPRSMWPASQPDPTRFDVWVSRDYLVQGFNEDGGIVRLSINRTAMLPSGRWDDGLSWDEIQRIKRDVGYGDRYAIEVYPEDTNVVNVANMRHIWILPQRLDVGWIQK